MTELPRRPIEPLPPPPGQFDAVMKQARYRRSRRVSTVLTVASVFFAGVAGGMSLDGGVAGVTKAAVEYAASKGGGILAPESPTNSASTTPKAAPTKRSHRVTTRPAPAVQPPAPVVQPEPPARSELAVRGRAVSTSGKPVSGLFVYPGRPGSDRFVPTRNPVARTATDGSFSLECTRTPVLLSPWPLNAPAGRFATTARWAATFVGGAIDAANAQDAPCTRRDRVGSTVVQHGSAVAGAVELPTACADAPRALWVWLHNDRQLTVRATGLLDGASFRVAGLPPGQHTVGAGGIRTHVTVGGGETLARDVTFGCDVEPLPTTTPSVTPSPAPTPSETDAPEPSSTGSGSPEPSGSTAADSESPSGTGQP